MSLKNWLVEIRTKDWIAGERHLGYVEVDAYDEFYARRKGYDTFTQEARYSPIIRRKLEARGLTPTDWCAPVAIEFNQQPGRVARHNEGKV